MVDFVERFFKLTLDNVYRFVCSVLAAVTVFGFHDKTAPVDGLAQLLDWLAVPSAWLRPVDEWLSERQEAVAIVATLTLIVAVLAAIKNWNSRSGSTALLSVVILIQVGQGTRLLTTSLFALVALAIATGVLLLFVRRLGLDTPEWLEDSGKKVLNVGITLFLAAVYIFSPLGWLISQESPNSRGTLLNPVYIEQVRKRSPSGALPFRKSI